MSRVDEVMYNLDQPSLCLSLLRQESWWYSYNADDIYMSEGFLIINNKFNVFIKIPKMTFFIMIWHHNHHLRQTGGFHTRFPGFKAKYFKVHSLTQYNPKYKGDWNKLEAVLKNFSSLSELWRSLSSCGPVQPWWQVMKVEDFWPNNC